MSLERLTDLLIRANRENAALKVQLAALEDVDEISSEYRTLCIDMLEEFGPEGIDTTIYTIRFMELDE